MCVCVCVCARVLLFYLCTFGFSWKHMPIWNRFDRRRRCTSVGRRCKMIQSAWPYCIYISLCTVSPKLTRKKISRRQYGLEQEAAMHCLAASFFGLPATWFLRRLQAPLDGFVKVRWLFVHVCSSKHATDAYVDTALEFVYLCLFASLRWWFEIPPFVHHVSVTFLCM